MANRAATTGTSGTIVNALRYTRCLWLVIVAFLAAAGGFAGITVAYAAPLTYSADTTVSLSSPVINLTIASGSTADSLTVNATSVLVSLSATGGNSLTLTSAQSDLSVSASAGGGTDPITCLNVGLTGVSGVDEVVITQQSGSATYTIAPAGTTRCMTINKSTGGITVHPIVIHVAPYASTTVGRTLVIPVTVRDPNGYEPATSATLPDDATFSTGTLRLAWSPNTAGMESSTIFASDRLTKTSAHITLEAFESVASETVASATPNRKSSTTRALPASTPRTPTIETLKANMVTLESKLLTLLKEYVDLLLNELKRRSVPAASDSARNERAVGAFSRSAPVPLGHQLALRDA